MKKILVLLILLVCVSVTWAGVFYYQNFRGIGPVVKPPPFDITTKIASNSATNSYAPAVNTTDIPLLLPNGFTISIYAKNLVDPRVIVWDPTKTLLVSIPSLGKVIALVDSNGDGVVDSMPTVVSGLNQPHGLAFHNGRLYIAETDEVAVYDYNNQSKAATNKHKIIDLPQGGEHVTRTIAFGFDGKLYISVGASCNACVESDWRRAKILVANDDGSNLKVFASGLRNSVFFIWNLLDKKMWATDMGRDYLGDDLPPDTIDVVAEGNDFGWPYCYGDEVQDMNFSVSEKAAVYCTTTTSSMIDYQAHSAPLGLVFIPKTWPQEYRNNLLVAMHGSWNRSVPTGYKLVEFRFDENRRYTGPKDFITGWLTPKGAIGRPVDLLFDDAGNLFVTDDKAGVIYKIVPPSS